MALALVTAARRLGPYFQSRVVQVRTDQPLQMILHKTETSGRLVKWSIKLSEFNIEYHPQGAIKGQAIVDFIAEYTYDLVAKPEARGTKAEEVDREEWVMHVDGSSTSIVAGGGVILVTPKKDRLEYAIRFGFKATNNETEYELMTTRLRLAPELGAKRIKVRSDSQLVVGQVQGDYSAKDDLGLEIRS